MSSKCSSEGTWHIHGLGWGEPLGSHPDFAEAAKAARFLAWHRQERMEVSSHDGANRSIVDIPVRSPYRHGKETKSDA